MDDVKDKILSIEPADAFVNMPYAMPEWIWEGQFALGCMTLLVGKPKDGKSLFCRNLASAIIKGEPFLDLKTKSSAVMYLALEEHPALLQVSIKKLGIDVQTFLLHVGPTRGTEDDVLDALERECELYQPKLVIIDPLARLVGFTDSNDYPEVYKRISKIVNFARKMNVHVLAVHHSNKGNSDSSDQIMGSTAFFGASDGAFFLSKDKNNFGKIRSSLRYGNPIDSTKFKYNENEALICLGKDSRSHSNKQLICEYLEESGPCEIEPLRSHLGVKNTDLLTFLKELETEGAITKEGKGLKGSPYIYSIPSISNLRGEQHLGGQNE